MNDAVGAKREMTTFERTISELQNVVTQARFDSGQYRELLSKLDHSPLESEQQGIPKTPGNGPMVEPPNTLLWKLNNIIDELNATNRRNAEIIKQFNTLL